MLRIVYFSFRFDRILIFAELIFSPAERHFRHIDCFRRQSISFPDISPPTLLRHFHALEHDAAATAAISTYATTLSLNIIAAAFAAADTLRCFDIEPPLIDFHAAALRHGAYARCDLPVCAERHAFCQRTRLRSAGDAAARAPPLLFIPPISFSAADSIRYLFLSISFAISLMLLFAGAEIVFATRRCCHRHASLAPWMRRFVT
jgi:hypothetical protein